jgi:hypothetical protein
MVSFEFNSGFNIVLNDDGFKHFLFEIVSHVYPEVFCGIDISDINFHNNILRLLLDSECVRVKMGFSINNFANENIVTNIVPIRLPFSISVKVGIHGVFCVEFFRYIDNESEDGLFFVTSGS